MRPFALALLAAGLAAGTASADVITSFTGGTDFDTFFPGQSFTTPAGGPWNQLTFNFFSDATASTPAAAGTLYLLTQAYGGTPAALSPATPGFLAASTGVSGGVYQFDPAATLLPGTQYFAYADTAFTLTGSSSGTYPGGNVYGSRDNGNFLVAVSLDANFRVSGTVVTPGVDPTPIPEPATLVTLGLLAAGGVARCRRRRTV